MRVSLRCQLDHGQFDRRPDTVLEVLDRLAEWTGTSPVRSNRPDKPVDRDYFDRYWMLEDSDARSLERRLGGDPGSPIHAPRLEFGLASEDLPLLRCSVFVGNLAEAARAGGWDQVRIWGRSSWRPTAADWSTRLLPTAQAMAETYAPLSCELGNSDLFDAPPLDAFRVWRDRWLECGRVDTVSEWTWFRDDLTGALGGEERVSRCPRVRVERIGRGLALELSREVFSDADPDGQRLVEGTDEYLDLVQARSRRTADRETRS